MLLMKEIQNGEYKPLDLDLRAFDILITTLPFRNNDGELIYRCWIETFKDTTYLCLDISDRNVFFKTFLKYGFKIVEET